MDPIKMIPAFRYGAATPWGGTGLMGLGKKIPDPKTGESLEISVLPGLESCSPEGETLTEILRRGGMEARGSEVGETFPLLLKYISAQDWLSVQVHPDDAYANAHENGKLGKTEAWMILDAEPGAQIVYGVRPGVTREDLRHACEEGGEAVKSCLRFVPVQKDEVYYIPAGMVHAMGAGVTVAEIQQSSDVTYRFYDWDRVDSQGHGRELHIAKGLDVIRTDLQMGACNPTEEKVPGGCCQHLISESAFTMDRIIAEEGVALGTSAERFRILTALTEGTLSWQNGEMTLARGDSVFIPASAEKVVLRNCGGALLMAPGR